MLMVEFTALLKAKLKKCEVVSGTNFKDARLETEL